MLFRSLKSSVNITIHTIQGATLLNEQYAVNGDFLSFNALVLSTGTYILTLTYLQNKYVEKMIVL